MASMNFVVLIGRVVAPPELRYTPGGKAVAQFTMAVDRGRGGKSENKETDFVPIVVWERLAEICNEYLQKGKLISIQGRLQTRSYETQDGQKRKAFEVVASEMQMLSSGGERNSGERNGGGDYQRSSGAANRQPAAVSGWSNDSGGFSGDDLSVDEIPF